MRVLVTGSAGLIGRGLRPALEVHGIETRSFDLVDGHDVRDRDRLLRSIEDCDGVVHLAAVSRVKWAEADPEACWATNVGGTRQLVELAQGLARRPFVLFASSREVYGEPDALPVAEDRPVAPVNVYGRSKVEGENAVTELGPRGAVVRLSNVYGDVHDHADRVVPAFVRAALANRDLMVEDAARTFDFTHQIDVAQALVQVVHQLAAGTDLPPLHIVSERPTSLGELAERIMALADGGRAVAAEGRTYDVTRFVGDGSRAATLLGWRATTPLDEGLASLVDAFRRTLNAAG